MTGRALSVYVPSDELADLERRGWDPRRLGPKIRELLRGLPQTTPSPSRPRRGRPASGSGEPIRRAACDPPIEAAPIEGVTIPTPAISRNVWIEE